MTFAVTWKEQGNVSMAADSCVTVKNKHMPYRGIKVFAIPVSVVDASYSHKPEIYNHIWGMAFAGSFTGVLIFKETIADILVRLQYLNNEPLSTDNIIHLAFSIYEDLYKDLQVTLASESFECLVAGYCPQKKKVRAYKFYEDCSDLDEGVVTFVAVSEILLFDGDLVEHIGHPKAQKEFRAEINVKGDRAINILRSIRRIIKQPNIPEVSGTIQYGSFNSKMNFEIKGVQDKREGGIGYYIRGTDFEQHQFANLSELMVSYKHILPFEQEIALELEDDLIKENTVSI